MTEVLSYCVLRWCTVLYHISSLFRFCGAIPVLSFYLQAMEIGISAMGAVLFGVYLVFDTQIMLGGHHKYAISPEEYIFAALNLYLDIVNMFLYILSILNEGRK